MMNFRKIFGGITSITTTGLVLSVLTVLPVLTVSVSTTNVGLFAHTSALAASDKDDDDGQRKPPQARSSQTLSKRVSSRVIEVMDFRDAEDYTSALEVLGEIKEMYDDERLNDREKHTMWLFYATIAQIQEKYSEAIGFWSEIIAMEDVLTTDQLEQALSSTGALHFVLEQYREAIAIYLRLIDIVEEPSADTYYRVGTAHYSLDEYEESIPYILRNMELVRAKEEQVPEGTYSLLRAMYYTIEDYESTLQILREMIVLFNEPGDWLFMAGMQSQLDQFDEQAWTYYVSNVMGYLDAESQIMSLASLLYNYDNPYGAAMVVEKGMASEVIEENVDNLSSLSLFYQVAREDAKAVIPLTRAAEMSDDGELYNRIGIIYSNMGDFEKAAEAFDIALEKGDLDRADQVYIRQAVAYYQLNRFDEGIKAATEAGKFEKSEETSASWIKSLTNEKKRYDAQEANRVLYEGFFL